MKSTDQVGISFANLLVASGTYNGVVNATLAAYSFDPGSDDKVDPAPVITCRLRMDRMCATQLRDRLNDILAAMDKADLDAISKLSSNGESRQPDESLN